MEIKFGFNFAIFIFFFGIAAIEAIQTKNWLKVAFWLAISLVFLFADNFSKNKQKTKMKKHNLLNYTEYLRVNPKGYWFKRKLYGWGWVPVRWQGWLFLAAWIGLFVQLFTIID